MKHYIQDNDQLEQLAVPTVELRHHQVALKRALVSRARAQQANKQPLTLQGWIHTMSTHKKLITGVGLASLLAITVVTFATLTPSQTVSAQQLARDTSQAVAQLSPAQRKAMSADYKKFSPQFEEWLRLAEHAPDLRELTYDQFIQEYPMVTTKPGFTEAIRIIDDPTDDDTSAPDLRSLRYLTFTMTADGNEIKVVLGVNDHNIPEVALKQPKKLQQPRVGA